uniref:Leucine-rich repeat-containing N-terminal plant-type domain-containing protein n=1 Tax=Oryza punctata TaxID=4537 RepID=A0A0E0KHR5_ORYPU
MRSIGGVLLVALSAIAVAAAGVVCDDNTGRVIDIQAESAGLYGTLPVEVGLLPELKLLDLRHNNLTGSLPSVVLQALETLHLDDNAFTSIPLGFLSNTRVLGDFTIDNNSGSLNAWKLPSVLGHLSALNVFDANNARVTGTLTSFLGNNSAFPNLLQFAVPNNLLSGNVPETFASETLVYLDLSYNNLDGAVDFITKLPNLRYLRLDHNGFTGPLPDLSMHRNLQLISLDHNRFNRTRAGVAGPAPGAPLGDTDGQPLPGSAAGVRELRPERRRRRSHRRELLPTGEGPLRQPRRHIPRHSGGLQVPRKHGGELEGETPCAGWLGVYCDRTSGAVVGVNVCRLGLNGTIAPTFGDLSSLQALLLAGNNITEDIPASISQLPSLRVIDMADNALQGTIPAFHRDVVVWARGNPNLTVPSISPPLR